MRELATQALKGERVTIYDRNGEGWAWGQLEQRRLCRLASGSRAGEARRRADAQGHRAADVCVSRSVDQAAAGRDAAARRAGWRSRARTAPSPSRATGWYLPRQHLGALDAIETDFVAVAERFVGTPYLWGGKSSLGIDCSGLVQVALNAAGTGCPRDSDMQESGARPRLVATRSRSKLQRGDLIFWKGHVAIVRDADTIVHANAHHMATAIENTRDAIARIKAAGSEVTSIKRL